MEQCSRLLIRFLVISTNAAEESEEQQMNTRSTDGTSHPQPPVHYAAPLLDDVTSSLKCVGFEPHCPQSTCTLTPATYWLMRHTLRATLIQIFSMPPNGNTELPFECFWNPHDTSIMCMNLILNQPICKPTPLGFSQMRACETDSFPHMEEVQWREHQSRTPPQPSVV